jgi:hypothetical protein
MEGGRGGFDGWMFVVSERLMMFVMMRRVGEGDGRQTARSPWYVIGRVKIGRGITSCVKHDQSTTESFLS